MRTDPNFLVAAAFRDGFQVIEHAVIVGVLGTQERFLKVVTTGQHNYTAGDRVVVHNLKYKALNAEYCVKEVVSPNTLRLALSQLVDGRSFKVGTQCRNGTMHNREDCKGAKAAAVAALALNDSDRARLDATSHLLLARPEFKAFAE